MFLIHGDKVRNLEKYCFSRYQGLASGLQLSPLFISACCRNNFEKLERRNLYLIDAADLGIRKFKIHCQRKPFLLSRLFAFSFRYIYLGFFSFIFTFTTALEIFHYHEQGLTPLTVVYCHVIAL